MPFQDHKLMLAAAKVLREAILKRLSEQGPASAGVLAAELGYARSTVSDCLQRLIKYQCVRVVRGAALCQVGYAEYHFMSMQGGGEGCETPRQPCLRVYPPNKVRDPFALLAAFFGRAVGSGVNQ